MADGGYQDNYGVATLVDWLEAALPAVNEQAAACGDRLRVVVVTIGGHETEAKGGNRSWAFQIGAPVQVLLAIRTAGPKARNDMELELLKGAGLGPRLGIACFEYVSDDSPLSWHLSDRQMRGIKDRWRAADIEARLQSLADFFAGTTATLSCPQSSAP